MLPEHHIEWIELIADDRVYRRELAPGAAPEAIFLVATEGEVEAAGLLQSAQAVERAVRGVG